MRRLAQRTRFSVAMLGFVAILLAAAVSLAMAAQSASVSGRL